MPHSFSENATEWDDSDAPPLDSTDGRGYWAEGGDKLTWLPKNRDIMRGQSERPGAFLNVNMV